jgi:glycosyltransferase involved in cell wall biosynthesis
VSSRAAIAIPAFQAGPFVGEVIRKARCHGLDILVVDDGSVDDTGARASEAGAAVIRHPVNRGKGCALRTAFGQLFDAGFEAVVTLDADGQHAPEEIPRLLRAASEGAHLVLGTRAEHFAGMGRLRRFSNGWSSWAISKVAGREFVDVQTGFRLYTRQLIEMTGFPEDGFEAESAVLVRAARRGCCIVAVPIHLAVADGRGTSHYRPVVDSLRIACAVTRARLEPRR